MVRFLDGLVLLAEVVSFDDVPYTASQLKNKFPDKIVVIRHISYIYKDVLCETAQQRATCLDGYLPLGELADAIQVTKSQLSQRIYFSKRTGAHFFNYMYICNQYFIGLGNELKELFETYQPFVINFQERKHIAHCRLLGDIKIGFY